MSTDSDIILRSRASPELFGQLYERHSRAIHRYAAGRAGAQVADDVMSETFLVAFERREKFDPAWEDARAWLFGIATNLLKAHRRVEARTWEALVAAAAQGHTSADGSADSPVERSDKRFDAQLSVQGLLPALKAMHAGERDVLFLNTWADLDYREIASALDIPIGTVRSRLNRARKRLQAAAGAGAGARINPPRTETTSWMN